MKLRQIFEAPQKVAVTAFGRMNPPTIGHDKLVNKITAIEGDHYLFLSQTQKPKDNPLPFDVKLQFAKKFFPSVNVGHPTVRTPIQMLQMLEKLGYTDIVYVAGSDRVEQFEKLFNDYNGKEYNFNSIRVVSAGERDPDADGAEGMSASKMRVAAAAGDFDSFAQGVPSPALAQKLYDAVRTGMGVKDTVSTEAGYRGRRDAYQRDYDSSVSGMGKRQSYAYSQDGGANDEGDDAIDAKIRADYERKKQYEVSGKFWLKTKDTQQHISDEFIGKAAANKAALELLKQKPELKGNLLITAYGPNEKQEGMAEGWKDKLAAAGLAGAMALGSAGAQARVSGGQDPNINRFTGKPNATQQSTDVAPSGFSKEYLIKAANPDRTGRFLISVEKAQELLKNMQEGVRDLGYDAQSLIMKLRRDVEEKRIQATPQAVLAAARELAGDMDFAPQLLVKQVLGQGVAEGYPKHQDLSSISTDKLKAYLAKQSRQQVSGEGNQVKRVQAELQRRSQGVAEGGEYNKFKVGQRATYKNSNGQEFPVIVTAVDFDDDAVEIRSADNKPFPNSGGDLKIVVDPGWKFLTPEPRVDPNSIIAVSPSKRKTTEASYEGNIGIMELFKFFSKAEKEDPKLVARVKEMIKQRRDREVWRIIQDYTGTQLTGKEFEGSIKEAIFREAGHGKYWCSTDKKWKYRQGPKQSRSS